MSDQPIPDFQSIQEEAAFWDGHDVTDFLDEFKPITVEYTQTEKKEVMAIRLAPSLKKRVEEVAQSYDISTSSLVRMWIVDRLRTLNDT